MGLRPRVPVDPEAFADPDQRQRWIEERGMMVFNLYDPKDPLRSVDLFVQPPIPFDELWSRSRLIGLPSLMDFKPGTYSSFASLSVSAS